MKYSSNEKNNEELNRHDRGMNMFGSPEGDHVHLSFAFALENIASEIEQIYTHGGVLRTAVVTMKKPTIDIPVKPAVIPDQYTTEFSVLMEARASTHAKKYEVENGIQWLFPMFRDNALKLLRDVC